MLLVYASVSHVIVHVYLKLNKNLHFVLNKNEIHLLEDFPIIIDSQNSQR